MKLRWALLPVLGAAAYFAVFGGQYSLLDLRRIEHERRDEATRLVKARAEVARLKARADSLEQDSGAIERLAREKYGLIRDGERLYRFAAPDSGAPRPAADSAAAPAPDPAPPSTGRH